MNPKDKMDKQIADAKREYDITTEIINGLPKRMPLSPRLIYTHNTLGGVGGLGFDASWEDAGKLMKALKPLKLLAGKQKGWAGGVHLPEYFKGKSLDYKSDCAPFSVDVNQHTGCKVEWYTMVAGKPRSVDVNLGKSNARFVLRIEYRRGTSCPAIVERDWIEFRNENVRKFTHDFVSASGSPEYPHGHTLWWDAGTSWDKVIAL